MRRSTLFELSGMELYEVAHVHRCFAGELAHGVRHAVVTPMLGQLGHGGEMPDGVFRELRKGPHVRIGSKPFFGRSPAARAKSRSCMAWAVSDGCRTDSPLAGNMPRGESKPGERRGGRKKGVAE